MPTSPSIQSKLIRWLVVPLTLFSILLFVYLYMFLGDRVNNFFDKRLFATAISIEKGIGVKDDKLFVDLPNFSLDLLSSIDDGYVYYSVIDDNDNLLIGYKHLFKPDSLKENSKQFYDLTYDGIPLKAVSYKTLFSSKGKEYSAFITVAESREERNANIEEMLAILLSVMAFVALFALLIMVIAIKQGLSPVNTLKKIIQKRDTHDLEPLDFDAPKELEDVVESMNILLTRSRNTIEYLEHFNSDVSHQLRTPLAELKVKLGLIFKKFEKDDKDFVALTRLIDNMANITEQLLLYAKTNTHTINIKRFEPLDLEEFCKAYSKKTAIRALKRGFDYAYEEIDERVVIKSDPVLLESMLDNIVNNAMHYAVDKENKAVGAITLSLERHNNTIWLSVKDDGEGLDKSHLSHIFDRYYRADSKKQGSGLGLNIVKQIAELHDAKVLAGNDGGLKISIIFQYPKDNHTAKTS